MGNFTVMGGVVGDIKKLTRFLDKDREDQTGLRILTVTVGLSQQIACEMDASDKVSVTRFARE